MNIMLHLKNIAINEKTAEADYSPESSGWWGHIVVDLGKQEIEMADEHPEYGMSYRGHAFWKLLDMANENDERTECAVMWY